MPLLVRRVQTCTMPRGLVICAVAEVVITYLAIMSTAGSLPMMSLRSRSSGRTCNDEWSRIESLGAHEC